MLARLHLLRHGEVDNPGGVVYSDLPGFGLSALGRQQAAAAAAHLAESGADLLMTSPLDRARETAGYVGRRLGLDPVPEPDLTEWGLSLRWAGVPWVDLEERFPGELAAYSTHPDRLPFSPESLEALATRMAGVVTRLGADHPGRVAVVVSHQDPIQALRRFLRGLDLAGLHADKPGHAAVVTLEPQGDGWTEVAHWAPAAGTPFPPPVAATEGG